MHRRANPHVLTAIAVLAAIAALGACARAGRSAATPPDRPAAAGAAATAETARAAHVASTTVPVPGGCDLPRTGPADAPGCYVTGTEQLGPAPATPLF